MPAEEQQLGVQFVMCYTVLLQTGRNALGAAVISSSQALGRTESLTERSVNHCHHHQDAMGQENRQKGTGSGAYE